MIVPDTPIDERVHTRKEVSAILEELHRKQADNPEVVKQNYFTQAPICL